MVGAAGFEPTTVILLNHYIFLIFSILQKALGTFVFFILSLILQIICIGACFLVVNTVYKKRERYGPII